MSELAAAIDDTKNGTEDCTTTMHDALQQRLGILSPVRKLDEQLIVVDTLDCAADLEIADLSLATICLVNQL